MVALLLPRTAADAYAAQLGTLQSGAAYAPIDPAFPDDRVSSILTDAQPAALITDGQGAARATRAGFDPRLVIDLSVEPLVALPLDVFPPRPAWLTPSTLAYVIYTSGSTGQPKGVAVEHRAIANLVASDLDAFHLSTADRIGHGSAHAYDSSIEEIWLALSAGATLVVMDDDVVRAGPDLVGWLERERISVLTPPPTLLRSMGRRDMTGVLPRLSLLYVGGEPLPRDVVEIWAPGRRLVNGYGPTECAVTALRGDILPNGPIDIGRPIAGVEAWVLDASLDVVPDGAVGELCVGGAGLARGYLNAPGLTARSFVSHPRLGRLYRTGDLAHREADGTFVYHGRSDTQVKLRGYRIELEDIESHLARLPGVRAAACRVESIGARHTLTAFVVATDPSAPPAPADLRLMLGRSVPAHMIPARVTLVDSLPTTVGGKLDRAALPAAAAATVTTVRPADSPDPFDEVERLVASSFRETLRRIDPVALDDDFFLDLGGDSLAAAQLVTALGDEPATASLSVRDVYEAPTIRRLAARARAASDASLPTPEAPRPRPSLTLATALQSAWLLAVLMVTSAASYAAAFVVGPRVVLELGLIASIVVAPLLAVAALALYVPASAAFAILMKRWLIGCYTPRRSPVWSGFYVRNWIVVRAVGLVPWSVLEGTALQQMILRGLGARIGRRVHIHRGVDLREGGWDLLEIGDHVSIGQDAALHLVDLDDGAIVVAPVILEERATLEVRAGVGGHGRVGRGACLSALSWLPAGGTIPPDERWDGVPAGPSGVVSDAGTSGPAMTETQFDLALLGSRVALALLLALPVELVAAAVCVWRGATAEGLVTWLRAPTIEPSSVAALVAVGTLSLPIVVVLEAWAARAMGPLAPGTISRWSAAYVRVWLKTGLVHSAGTWLSGGLLWPVWLRAAGMRVGPNCEISTIIDVVPEHLEIGAASFLADGVYLGGPRVDRGVVTLSSTTIGDNVFIGNHAVIGCGQHVPDGVLIGVSTVVGDEAMRPGTAWFGHPAFELRRRPPADADRRLTHDPPTVRRLNRLFWELLRFGLPVVPLIVGVAWMDAVAAGARQVSPAVLVAVVAPAATLAAGAVLALAVLVLKWGLLGRVAPGQHPLWCCWCSRWDFLYVAWGQLAVPAIAALEGTILLAWYLRAMGATIGRRVVLGPGFAQMVDPDMLQIDDEATVQASFQAHTFEDRVLKIDRVRIGPQATIGRSAVMLSGSEMGRRTRVAPHSVVMKRARLRAGASYDGCPTRPT